MRRSDPGEVDRRFMGLALEEARRGLGRTSPNPAVGAVIVRGNRVLAAGWHRRAGSDHAEVAALRKLDFRAAGCTLYSTLEPCDHVGRTGPCTEAILRAGIRRVVIGASDPNPLVRGRGVRKLRARGVEIASGVLEAACTELNEAFNYAIVHRRPFVTLKAAVSLDGRIATARGDSRWITSPQARREGHRLRDRSDAVVVGVGTVLADDPELTARVPGGKHPLRVVLDSRLRTPLGSKLVKSAGQVATLIATSAAAAARKRRALERAGVEVVTLPAARSGGVSLPSLLDELCRRGLNAVLVEGGAEVHGAFLDAGLVQRVVWFVAPLLIGGKAAPAAIGGRGANKLADARTLGPLVATPIGPDWMITARVIEE